MSDIGYLSYEYRQTTDLANRLERALAEWEENRLTLQSRQQLALSLSQLLEMLSPLGDEPPSIQSAVRVPGPLIAALRDRDYAGRPWKEVLEDLSGRLGSREATIAEEDRQLLSAVAGVAETTASDMYRKMVRR
jgi:hypothetical protein